jgi:tetratricopeptide (TPR) repeat protein
MTRKRSKKAKKKVQKKSTSNRKHIYWPLAILTITFIAYLPTFQNEFTNWDDYEYVVKNFKMRNLGVESIKAFFSDIHMGNYHPLTMLSLAIDYHISGLSPNMYQFTNILLHLINTTLVFWLVLLLLNHIHYKRSIEIAIITAVLFGVHTLHVESVSWVSERKDVLYSMFFLFSLIAYVKYVIEKKNKFYFYSLILFLLSLLSKGQAVSLAVTILAVDYLFSRKLLSRKVILEKIPFFALALAFGFIAIYAQQSGESIHVKEVSYVNERILFACYGFIMYIFKLIIPLRLSAYYSYPDEIHGSLPVEFWFYLVAVVALIVLFIYLFKKQKRVLVFAFLFYVMNIFLVLQLLPVGNAIMADRYSYIPSIGFFFLIGIGYSYVVDRSKNIRVLVIFIMIAYVILLAFMTSSRIRIWHDSLTLWNNVISRHDNFSIPYINRGSAKEELDDYEGALEDYNKAISLSPELFLSYNNRGNIFYRLKDFEGALKDYNKAISLNSNYYLAYDNRGTVHLEFGNIGDAIKDYNKAVSLNPDFDETYYNRGVAKARLGDFQAALIDYDKAIEINDKSINAYHNRGLLKGQQLGDLQGALSDFNTLIKLKPSESSYYDSRGIVNSLLGQHNRALDDFDMAIKLNFNNVNAYLNRARTLLKLGKFDKAKQDVLKAQSLGCKVNPLLIKEIEEGSNTGR